MTAQLSPEDWTTIWQSEMAALAVDREWLEGLGHAADAWNAAIAARIAADAPPGSPGPDAPPRPPAAEPASGPGDADKPRRRAKRKRA